MKSLRIAAVIFSLGIFVDNGHAQTNVLNSTGSAGIGTTSPLTSLHVLGPFTPAFMQMTIQASGSDNRSGISLLNTTGNRIGALYAGSGGDFIFGLDQSGMIRFFS